MSEGSLYDSQVRYVIAFIDKDGTLKIVFARQYSTLPLEKEKK